MTPYNDMEIMITIASRELEDGATVGVGTGAPCAAAMLAQKTGAHDLVVMFEAGGMSPRLPEMPISVGDSRTFYKAAMAGSMSDTMETCARGFVDYTFLGGAQIDCFGNLNSTLIGTDHARPKVRFPGSGGANDFASLCRRTMVITPQDPRRFVDQLDFLTTPGWLSGGTSRRDAGLPADTGPYKVITNMGVMDYEPVSKRMRVCAINPGYDFDTIQAHCGFELLCVNHPQETAPPTVEELDILRNEVDPHGYLVGRQ